MSSSSSRSLLAAALGCVALFLSSCSPTTDAGKEPLDPAPPADVSPPIDVQAVIRRVQRSFHAEEGAFHGGQSTYSTRVDGDGTVRFSTRQWAEKADAAPHASVTARALALKTASVSRGGRALTGAAVRAAVREQGELALSRGPVVEVLENGEEGLEQRWELAGEPEGSGELEVRVELTGLTYAGETEGGHHFVDPRTGLGVRYGKATWVDARGTRTPVPAVREGEALVLRVPGQVLEDSAWPAVLDPVVSPESSPDTPVLTPSYGTKAVPRVAYAEGIFLVVWQVVDNSFNIRATRVRAWDGRVLDELSIPLAVGTGDQSSPAVATDGHDFLVAWVDRTSGTPHIQGARVSSSTGALLDSTPLALSPTTSSQISPAIAFNGVNYLVVWSDGATASSDISGTRVRPSDGTVLDPAGIALSTAAGPQSAPSVAADGMDFLVAWMDNRSGVDLDIRGTRVSGSQGVALDPEGLQLSMATGDQRAPVVAFADGMFFVAWEDKRSGTSSDVYGTRVRAADAAVLEPSGLPLATGTLRQGENGTLTLGSTGSAFLVAWQQSSSTAAASIVGVRVGLNGVVQNSTPVVLTSSAWGDSRVPAVAFDGSRFLVVWMRFNSSNTQDVIGARVDGVTLKPLDAEPRLYSALYNTEATPVVASGGGYYLVVWEDRRDNNGNFDDLYGVRIRISDGVVVDSTAIPIARMAETQTDPAVAFDGTNFLVVWSTYTGSSITAWDIRGARVRASDGVVLDPSSFAISNANAGQAAPVVAFGEGTYFVAWRDSRTSPNTHVYGARVRASDRTVLDSSGIFIGNTWTTAQNPLAIAYGGGSFLVAWEDWSLSVSNSNLFAKRVRASDGVVLDSTSIPLCTASGGQSHPALAFDGTQFLGVWADYRSLSTNDLYGNRVRASDGAVLDGSSGRPLVTGSDEEYSPALAFDGGNFLLTWTSRVANVMQIRGARVAPSGGLLDSHFLISDFPREPARPSSHAVAAGGPGRWLVVYDPYDAAAQLTRIKARRVSDPLANGATCANGGECTSGFCVGGICCDTACTTGTCGTGTCTGAPPIRISCPAPLAAEATGSTGATVSYPPATATGQDPLTVSYSRATGSLFALGPTTVTATVTDGLSRGASCTFGVTVRDTTGPTLGCEPDRVVEATSPSGAPVTYPLPPATDTVTASPTVVMSHSSGSVFRFGTTWVTATATDAASNSSTCGFFVTVRDTSPPTLSCPQDVVVDAPPGATGTSVTYPPAVAQDASAVTLQYSRPSGSSFDLGTTPVTVTATDALGHASTCGFSVTVNQAPPQVTCPMNLTAEATGASGALVTYPPATAAGTAPLTLAYSQDTGTLFPLGPTSVTATVTDGLGRTTSCAFSVTVSDTVAPDLRCGADVVAEATGPNGTLVSFALPTATDAVTEPPSVSSTPASGSLFPLGTTPVSVTASDAAGNAASCSFQVHVRDTTAPDLVCPGSVSVVASRTTGASVSYPPATVSDAVSSVTPTYSQASGSDFGLGTTHVTVRAVDEAGNASTCGFDVTVSLPPEPTLSCPDNPVAEATSDSGALVTYPPATATGTGPLTVTYSQEPGTRFAPGTTPVTATVTDGLGRTASCSFGVTVRDTTAPELTCPDGVTAEATRPEGALVSYPPATASDTTSSPSLHYSQDSGTLFALGTTSVTVTATDTAGNSASCAFSVTVRDTTAPQLGCPSALTVEAQGPTGATAVFSTPAPRDDVTRSPSVSSTHAPGSRFPLGTTEVVLSAMDDAGNSASCSFRVTVHDTTAPSLTCPADLEVKGAPAQGSVVEYPDATYAEAVSVPTLTYSAPSGALFPPGTTPVTVTATDTAGNSATCSFQVNVEPAIAVSTPAGCGCGASEATSGLTWAALLLLSVWAAARRGHATGR